MALEIHNEPLLTRQAVQETMSELGELIFRVIGEELLGSAIDRFLRSPPVLLLATVLAGLVSFSLLMAGCFAADPWSTWLLACSVITAIATVLGFLLGTALGRR